MIDRSYQANQDGSLGGKWAGFRQHDPANKLGRSDANKNSGGRCSCSWVLVVWDRPCWGHTTTAQFKCETDATALLEPAAGHSHPRNSTFEALFDKLGLGS